MEYRLHWSHRACLHLKSIESYIAKDSPFRGKKIVNDIIDHAESLKLFPEMGPLLQDFPHLGLRQLSKYSYRIIYYFSGDVVTVIAVVHGKREYIEIIMHD